MSANLPYNLQITNTTPNSATLFFTSGGGAWQTDISLYRNSDGYCFWERYQPCQPYQSLYYDITGLAPNTTYYVRLRSIDSTGAWDGTYTDSLYFTTDEVVIPSQPTNIQKVVNQDQIWWGWTDGANTYKTQYRVYRASDNALVDSGYEPHSETQTSHVTSSLEANTQYYLRLRSVSESGGYSDWTDSVYATSLDYPTCYKPISISAVYNLTTNCYDISALIRRGLFTTWIEYTPNDGEDWVLIDTIIDDYPDNEELTNLYWADGNAYGTASCSLDLSIFGGDKTFQFRVCNKRTNWYSSQYIYSENYTYTKPKCPQPTNLQVSVTNDIATIDVTAQDGYRIEVDYYDGVWNWLSTSQTSPYHNTLDCTDMGVYYVLHVRARCSKTDYVDSDWLTLDLIVDNKPSNSTLFNFTQGQEMTAQNVVKVSDGNYTADAIVMPASTWNSFTSKINSLRAYYDRKYGTSLGNYSFTSVSSGATFTATIYNQAINAINAMFDTYEYLSTLSSGASITAALLMGLQSKLNSVS